MQTSSKYFSTLMVLSKVWEQGYPRLLSAIMVLKRVWRICQGLQFAHMTSSPLFAQSNGQVEQMVQTMK